MIANNRSQIELEHRIVGRVMDAFVRIGLVLVLALLCYRAVAPFLTLLIWSLILAVALYPLSLMLASIGAMLAVAPDPAAYACTAARPVLCRCRAARSASSAWCSPTAASARSSTTWTW